ncbi:MAG: hypothetical protein GY898_30260 [Proteobacteria bacterium]|nr:hypothetical protein [Pseudomonadota bacterium]
MARRKPKNLKLGAVGVYVVRGPREDRRWYWPGVLLGRRQAQDDLVGVGHEG